MGGSVRVRWRGVTVDERTRSMLDELARCVRPLVHPTQGSYSTGVKASAGTHNGGGAVDIRARDLDKDEIDEIVRTARILGFAAWFRPKIIGLWPAHIHMIAIDCPDLSPGAAAQVADYRAGLNGLASHGSDDGPSVPIRTWEQYLQDLKNLETKDWFEMATKEELQKIVRDELAELLGASRGPYGAPSTNMVRYRDGGGPRYAWLGYSKGIENRAVLARLEAKIDTLLARVAEFTGLQPAELDELITANVDRIQADELFNNVLVEPVDRIDVVEPDVTPN